MSMKDSDIVRMVRSFSDDGIDSISKLESSLNQYVQHRKAMKTYNSNPANKEKRKDYNKVRNTQIRKEREFFKQHHKK